jgi:tRNA(Arg) A34 adenosine deaminase TadA
MKRAFELALDAVKKGNPPFGALLVQDHKIIFEYENTENTTNDVTKHAETGLISAASPKFSREIRKKCTLYTSTEPCTMCSGAIIWAEFHRVVYGVTETQMERLMPGIPIPKNPLTCKEVMRRSAPQIEVVGPLMEAEGLKAHDGYWTAEMLK